MALGDVIARLSVQLALDSAVFEKNAKQAGRTTQDLGDKAEAMGTRVGKMGKAFIAAGAAVAGSALVGQIAGLVQRGLEHASALGEQAQQLGVTTKALQEYRYVATQVGISQEEMDAALAKLTRTMGEAERGAKKPSAAFQKLGIDIKAFIASGKDAGDLIPLIAAGLEKIPSPAEKAAIQVDLFGRAGQKLAPLLNEGAGGINNLRDAAQKMGIVLSDKQIQDADNTADKLAALKTVLEAKIAGIVADNASAILAFADGVETLVSKFTSLLNVLNALAASPGGKFLQGLNTAAGYLNPVTQGVRALGGALDAAEPQRAAPRRGSTAPVKWPTSSGRSMLDTSRPVDPRFFGQNTGTMGGAGRLSGQLAVSAYLPIPASVLQSIEDGAAAWERYWEKASGGKAAEEAAESMDLLNERTKTLKVSAKDTAETFDTSFQQAADGVIGALQRMSSAFSGGSFLDKLGAILGIATQLGSIGAFGKKVQTSINLPKHANGTSFAPGGLSLVGERGPELVNLPRGSRVTPNNKLGGSNVYNITGNVLTEEMWATIQALDVQSANAGANGGVAKMAHQQSRRLG